MLSRPRSDCLRFLAMVTDWEREERLTRVARAWSSDSSVFLSDDASGVEEGSHAYTGFGSTPTVDMFVARRLADPDAEATVLHELAHVELGHDDDPEYAAALARDKAARTDHHRGKWEIEADALAAAMVDDQPGLLTDPDQSIEYLVEDALRYR